MFGFCRRGFFTSLSDVNTSFWTIAAIALLSQGAIGMVMPNLGKTAMGASRRISLIRSGDLQFYSPDGRGFGVNVTALSIDMQTAKHSDILATDLR